MKFNLGEHQLNIKFERGELTHIVVRIFSVCSNLSYFLMSDNCETLDEKRSRSWMYLFELTEIKFSKLGIRNNVCNFTMQYL